MRQLSAAVATAVLITGCAVAPEEDPVQIKLNELESRIERIERVVSNQSLLDLAQRLDAAQADVRTLRGRLEELENSTEGLRKQQRNLYADLDRRLNALSTAPGGAMGSGTAADEQALYAQAFDALKAANYPGAIAGFQQYLSAYPDSEMADSAQYWLGEAYYVTRDYERAGAAFRIVGERWPNSRRAADALLKLGLTQYEMKRYPEARATLTQVTQRYPDSDAARQAQERLQRLPAGAR